MSKFREVQRFTPTDEFERWFEVYWNNFANDFNTGIENVDFENNFKSKRVTVDVSDSAETTINHNLGITPSAHLVLNGVAGVIRSATAWSNTQAYLILDSDLYTSKTKSVDVILLA